MNQRQTGKIIDLLSEGPIEGIVGDDAGIFLNGTPVIDSEERETLGYVPGEISFVSGVTYDFTPDSGFDLTEIDLAIGDRNIIVWDAINEGSTDAYIKAQKHPYVLKTPNVTWTDADIGSLIILGDGQNGATETFRVASIHTYSGPSSFIKIDRASQGPYGDSNTRQLWRAQIRQVQSIVNSTRITVDSAFTESLTNRKATLLSINSTSLDTSVSTKNFESVKTIFRSGRQDQPILDPVFGGGQTAFATNLNEEILQTTRSGTYSISGQDDKVYTATTTMGISSPENIDKVKINIRFPSLIAYSKIGSEYSQGIEFQIFLEYKRNGVWYNHTGTLANFTSNQPVFGISDDDIQNRNPVNIDSSSDTEKRVTKYALATSLSTKNDGMVITQSKTEFVKEFLIDSELTKSKPFTDFRIRIKRVTGVNIAIRDESQAQTQSYMQGIFGYSNDILNYANTAVAGISFQSNDFDEFPKRAYLARGIRVQVPTNYITREESGGSQAKYTRNVTTGADTGSEVRWDGKFRGDIADTSWRTNQGHVNYKKVYTNNPAWVYYDIMVNNRYGLGEFLGAQNINKYELYRIARYCDELVPDGKGGTEPRFTCNLYLQSRTEAFKVINDLASVFRSIVKWTNGEISASQDAPKAPIYTFSNSNVLDGQFGYESTSKRLRINQVGVTWNNPEDFYKQDVVTVEDSESILEEGKIIKKDTIAVGCTSEGQATRLGKWMLLTERLETELVKFRTGINGAYLRPGDIFYVQDYNRTNAIASGRLAQSNNHTTTTVYFDRTVPFEADTYQLHLAFPTGSAYLQQEQATINGTTYYRGDQITQAYVGGVLTNIDSTEDAADALDAASGNFVQLSWSEYISVESREFVSGSNQNLDSITVSSAFTSVPNSEVMFTLTNITDSNTAKGAVAYRTLNITENEDKTIDISGHLYLADKFAAVDRGYLLQPREFTPLPTFDNIRVPAPQNPSLSINRLSDTQDSTDVQLYSYVAEVSWGHPVVEGTDENYQYVDYYEIKHPYTPDRTYETAKATKATEFTFTSFVDPGQAYVLVRTVNIQGRRSAWSVVERAGTSDLTGSALNTISFLNLRAGGNVDTSLSVNVFSGSVSFENENFNVIGPQGNNYSLTGISTLSQGSPEISNGGYAYIVFDASSSSFKFLEIETDTVAEDPATGLSPPLNFEYWRESGQNAFTSVGTISQDIDILDLSNGSPGKALFVNKFTTTADYSSSFSFGDIIRIGSGASSWYGTVLEATATQITTVEYINKAFSSGASIFNQDFKADNALDFIIGRIYNNAAIYELEIFAATKGSKGDTPETVSLSADSFVVKYDGDEVLLEGSPNNNITLTATPGGGLGIEGISPEYRFIEMPSTVKQDWSTSATYTIPEADLPAINTTIQYKVEATDDGSPYTSEASDFLTIVTVAEGRDAETVNLEADNYVAKYDGTGTLIDSSPTNNITLTATSSAGLSSPTQYRFTELPSTVKQDWSTDNTYVIPQVDLPEENTTITYKVEVTDGASPYSSEASDTVTIAAISDGSVGSPGTDGRPGLPGASRILPYNNLETDLPNVAGEYAFLSGSTPAYVTSWADIKSAEVIQLRPFTDPLTTNQSQYYDQIKEGDVITYYITSGKWVDYVVDVNNGLTGSPGAYEFEVTALEFDETGGTADPDTNYGFGVKFRFSRATEAISGVITNDTHAEAADQDGTLLNDLTDAGGNFLVFKGIQEVTNESPAPSFGRSPATIDGLTMSIDAAGVYSLSGTWTGTQAQFELTATYEGFTVTKQYTIVKTLEGAASVLGFLTNESHVEAADNAGDLLDTLSDAGGTFTVFDGVVDVTTGSGVVYSVVGGSGSPSVLTTSGLQMSINTSTGIYTLSENSDWTADTTTFTLRAVYSAHSPSVTVDRVYTISKSKTGAAGAAGSDAQAVSLTADKYIAAYDGTGTLLDSSPTNNIILTASSQGFEASPPVEYRFLKNGVQVQAYSTTATYTIPEASLPAANAQDEYKVEAGSGGSPVEAFDTVSVYGLQDGADGSPGAAGSPGEDAIVGFIENEAHVEPADFGGQLTSTPILDTAGGAFKVYEGITEVTSSTTFTVVGGSSSGGFHTKTQNGLKISIDETGAGIGEYTLSEDSDWTSDSETFTLRGVYNSVTVDKVYSISKTREGIPERIPGVKYGDGAMNWRLKANLEDDNSTKNPGEIYVRAGTYRLPGGNTRVISANTQINTPFEGSINPKDWGSKDDFFYVFSYNSDVDTRFGAPSPNAGFGPAASDGLFTAVYVHDTQTWYATPNNSTGTASSYSFTPDEQDHIIALGFKDNAGILVSPPGSQGINLLYEVVPVVDEPLATIGATSGISLYSASGGILDDIDIRDDQKALTLMGGSIVPNAGFGDYYRVNPNGNSAPRHWYGSGSANAAQFLSDTQRDVVFIPQTSSLRYSSDAFSVNLDTEYEVAILARKSVGGDATRLRVRVQELESDMPTGKRFLSSVNVGSPGDPKGEDFLELELADNTISLTNPNVAYASGTDWDLTTSFDIYYGTYTPSTSLVRWASIYFDAANNNPATGNLEVEWFTIRDKSTLGATAGTNLFANDGSVIKDSVITNFDDASALSFNPAFTNWTGGTPDGWTKAGTFTLNQGTDSLTGPYAVECVCTGANGGFISRHNNEDSPTITFDISGDAVLIGSVDVKISSYTSGTPGISADLMQSNSIYYRQVIPAGTGSSPPTGTWQRLYFKVSAYSNNVEGKGGPTPGNNYVGVKIGLLCDVTTSNTSTGNTSAFTGTVIYDNVRFAIIDPALENEQQIWADISGAGLPEDNATVGAQTNKNITNEVLVEEDFADFNLTRVLQTWDEPTGDTNGEISIISTSVAKNYGGYALRVGNDDLTDSYRLVVDRARAMPLEFNQLYKITFVAKTTSGSGVAYLGLQGWKGNVRNGGGTSVTNTGGTGIGTIGHYIAAQAQLLTTSFEEYTAYFKRNINAGSVATPAGANLYNSPLNPWFIHTDAEFVSPLMILNFNNSGLTEVSYVKLERVEPPSVSEQPTDGGALLINPNFNIPNAENIDRPAGWWSGTTTTQPEYDDKSTSELLGSSDTVVSNAFKVDSDKQYRVTARIKSSSGGGSTVSINVNEYNSDLDVAGGKYAIGGSFNTDPIQQRNQNKALSPAVTTKALTTTYEIITGLYTPTSTTKWASLNFYDDATSAFILDWVTVEVDSKVSSSAGAPVVFNIDGSGGGTNFHPDVRGEYKYTFTASTSQLGTNGNFIEGSNPNTPWQRHRIYFYKGENEIADFEFISLFNYVTSSGGRSNNQTVRTLWRSASYATGYSDSDFTVQIDGTTKTRWSTTSVTYGAAAHEYWNSTMYDGNNGQYTVRITHTESGHIHDQLVYVTPIVNGLDGEAPKA